MDNQSRFTNKPPSSDDVKDIFKSHSSYRPALAKSEQRTLKPMRSSPKSKESLISSLDLEDDYFSQNLKQRSKKVSASSREIPTESLFAAYEATHNNPADKAMETSPQIDAEPTAPSLSRAAYKIPFEENQIRKESTDVEQPSIETDPVSNIEFQQPPFDKLVDQSNLPTDNQRLRMLAQRLVKAKDSFLWFE